METVAGSSSSPVEQQLQLPLGFHFVPTDQELISHFVKNKNSGLPLPLDIPVEDLYKCHPKRVKGGLCSKDNKRYYFTQRKPRDPLRVVRSTGEGFWKDTSKDKAITDGNNTKIGNKKTFTFYEGKKKPTKWIMHEFRDLEPESKTDGATTSTDYSRINHYVICMIYENEEKSHYNSVTSTLPTDPGITSITEEIRESSTPQNQAAGTIEDATEGFLTQNPITQIASTPLQLPNMNQLHAQHYVSNCQHNLTTEGSLGLHPTESLGGYNEFYPFPNYCQYGSSDQEGHDIHPTQNIYMNQLHTQYYDSNDQHNLTTEGGLGLHPTESICNYNEFLTSNYCQNSSSDQEGLHIHPTQSIHMNQLHTQYNESNCQHNLTTEGGLGLHPAESIGNYNEFSISPAYFQYDSSDQEGLRMHPTQSIHNCAEHLPSPELLTFPNYLQEDTSIQECLHTCPTQISHNCDEPLVSLEMPYDDDDDPLIYWNEPNMEDGQLDRILMSHVQYR